MSLRTRIFLLVSGVFVVTMILVAVVRHVEVTHSITKVKDEITKEIHRLDIQKREDILAFLGVEVIEVEMRINTLLNKIQDFEWLKKKYMPSMLNYRTNDWSNSGVLLLSHDWLDLIQTTNRGKLTAHIQTRPPYLRGYIRIPVNENLYLFVGRSFEENPIIYVGVPYWSNQLASNLELGLHEMNFHTIEARDYWLLFTAEQLLAMDTSKLHWHGISMPTGPLEPSMDLKSQKVYKSIVENTIKSVIATQETLRGFPHLIEIMNSETLSKTWIKEKVGEIKPLTYYINPMQCKSFLCKQFRADQLQWFRLHDWSERADQNHLIWQLATITGSGLWNFDPLNRESPVGIVSFPTQERAAYKKLNPHEGTGMLSKDVFKNFTIPPKVDCKLQKAQDKMDTCISNHMQIYVADDNRGVFILNSMEFVDMQEETEHPATGTLTLGVDIMPILRELALASPDQVFFVTKEGKGIALNTHGEPESLDHWSGLDFDQMLKQDHGIIQNDNGEEFYFLHITQIVNSDGHVFIVQFKDSEVLMIEKLDAATRRLAHQITVQYFIMNIVALVLALIVLDRLIKSTTKPIRRLARGTRQVAAGEYDQIHISAESRNRKDEIGVLIASFAQMVDDLKQGEEVRSILDKVVSKEIAEKILKEGVALGGEQREVTMLFADIRNFTHISEKMEPHEVLEMLNDCLTVLSQVIDENEGVIDKYVGDEIVALFGAPLDCKNSSLRAIQCAKTMRAVLTEWNHQREQAGKTPLSIGISVHTGEVIAGNVGAERHLSYTVLGHNVNLTARICDHAGPMEILITEECYNQPGVKENIQVESVGGVELKGISTPIPLYRVL